MEHYGKLLAPLVDMCTIAACMAWESAAQLASQTSLCNRMYGSEFESLALL